MKNIEVAILNKESIMEAEKMMVAMARLTQRGQEISSMDDLVTLLNKQYTAGTVEVMSSLPHPTIQKFSAINIAIVGASRRFLAQITRHQNEIKFMSGSLQYSDYSDAMQFCVPYEITRADAENHSDGWCRKQYLNSCLQSMDDYKKAGPIIGRDAAGYMAPQGMRNVLIMSVLPYELKHIISQRGCSRNTLETQYVMLKIWELLYKYPMFRNCGPMCTQTGCQEGRMSCGKPLKSVFKGQPITPTEILHKQFPLLYEEDK